MTLPAKINQLDWIDEQMKMDGFNIDAELLIELIEIEWKYEISLSSQALKTKQRKWNT